MSEIARLRIEIDDVTPPVIRRVEVPVTIRLDDLHFVLQIAIGWQNCHPFELEAMSVPAPGINYPRLVSAQGRCPPADIGGPMGYETFLQAIMDPRHLHHEGMIEWDDPDFDPNTVDEAAIRANLANLGRYLGRRKGEPRCRAIAGTESRAGWWRRLLAATSSLTG